VFVDKLDSLTFFVFVPLVVEFSFDVGKIVLLVSIFFVFLNDSFLVFEAVFFASSLSLTCVISELTFSSS
jgi:hypothetical protein